MTERDDFEEYLKHQPVRHIPEPWRADILATAKAGLIVTGGSSRSFDERQESFWPSPVAWAALACVWLVILGLNLTMPKSRPTLAVSGDVFSPEKLQIIAEQRRIYALYLDFDHLPDRTEAKPSKPNQLGPRSEKQNAMGIG